MYSPALVARGVLDLVSLLFLNNPIDHDLRVFPGSPGSPNVSSRPPVDLHSTSSRPPVDLRPIGVKPFWVTFWPLWAPNDRFLVLRGLAGTSSERLRC